MTVYAQPGQAGAVMDYKPRYDHWIGGQYVAPSSGQYFENPSPVTGRVFTEVARGNAADIDKALDAAHKAAPAWGKTSVTERANILNKIADRMEANLEALAVAETWENGKPVRETLAADIPLAIDHFRYFAGAIRAQEGTLGELDDNTVAYHFHEPLGVVGQIIPWNFPLLMLAWKIAPALAVGNCVVAKPSELTPYTAFLFSKICIEAGLPAGVLNIVHGTGPNVGEAIVNHNKIKALSFTGGTATGKRIASILAPQFKKMSLELGGKNATLVFDNVDIEKTVNNVVRASFANQGQICLCGSRILLQRGIYDAFKKALVEKVSKMKVSDPLNPDSKFGALVSAAHLEKVKSYIEIAKSEGGTILCGGFSPEMTGDLASGYYLQPTLIEGLDAHCRTNQEEIFGPVATLIPFDTEEQAIEWANCTPYGLAASIWTNNISQGHRVAQSLETGISWVNTWLMRDLRTPFGGVKQSGLGREGGWEAFRFFTEPQNICIDPNH